MYPCVKRAAFDIRERAVIFVGEATKYTADMKNPWTYTWVGFDGTLASKLDELSSPVFELNTRVFKRRTGKTMREYLCECRMKEAKKLLNMGYNVNETADMLGYCDQSTFSRAYKTYHKTSPKSK